MIYGVKMDNVIKQVVGNRKIKYTIRDGVKIPILTDEEWADVERLRVYLR